jgi:hypothetical protein
MKMFTTTLATVSTISPSLRPALRALEVRAADFAALDNYASREFQYRICFPVSVTGANGIRDLLLGESDFATDKYVCAQAVAAQVAFRDDEADLFLDLGIESSTSECGAEDPRRLSISGQFCVIDRKPHEQAPGVAKYSRMSPTEC